MEAPLLLLLVVVVDRGFLSQTLVEFKLFMTMSENF